MVKSEQLLYVQHYHLLDDIELISAISYCRKLIGQKDDTAVREFKDLVSFFFEDDKLSAIKTLQKIEKIYRNEFSKRHQN